MANHQRMRRPRNLRNEKFVTRPYQNATLEGLGMFSKLPFEIRLQIWGYIMDINSKREEYLKGVEGFQEGQLLSPARLRRTSVLAVSKALCGETLAVMLSTNRFFLRPCLYGTTSFELFALKDALGQKHASYGHIPLHPMWKLPCPYVRFLTRYITSRVRMLVLLLQIDGTTPEALARENFSRILKFVGRCKRIDSFRMVMDISLDLKVYRDLVLSAITELSDLRSVRNLEVRGSCRPEVGSYNYLRAKMGSAKIATQSSSMINEQRGTGILLLAKDYLVYLNSTVRNHKGVEVEPYKGFVLTDVPEEMGPGDIRAEALPRFIGDFYALGRHDTEAWDDYVTARQASCLMPWWYSKSIPAP